MPIETGGIALVLLGVFGAAAGGFTLHRRTKERQWVAYLEQVGQEMEHQLDGLFRDIATHIHKCIRITHSVGRTSRVKRWKRQKYYVQLVVELPEPEYEFDVRSEVSTHVLNYLQKEGGRRLVVHTQFRIQAQQPLKALDAQGEVSPWIHQPPRLVM